MRTIAPFLAILSLVISPALRSEDAYTHQVASTISEYSKKFNPSGLTRGEISISAIDKDSYICIEVSPGEMNFIEFANNRSWVKGRIVTPLADDIIKTFKDNPTILKENSSRDSFLYGRGKDGSSIMFSNNSSAVAYWSPVLITVLGESNPRNKPEKDIGGILKIWFELGRIFPFFAQEIITELGVSPYSLNSYTNFTASLKEAAEKQKKSNVTPFE